MKKVLVLATAALLISGVSFAQDKTKTKEKEKCTKECCKKDGKADKDCCKKETKTAEKKTTTTKTKA